MIFFLWWRRFRHPRFGRLAMNAKRRPRRALRLRLEPLEDRITPTTFTPTVFTDGVSAGAVNTLRDAILAANNDSGTVDDVIQLAAGTYTLSIPNSSGHETQGMQGDLNINPTNHALIIKGVTDASGKPATLIDQTVADRVFQISGSGPVVFDNVVIEGGDAQDDGTAGAAAGSTVALGGGIDIGSPTSTSAVVQIRASTLSGNKAEGGSATGNGSAGSALGGGAAFAGTVTLVNSTIAGNDAIAGNSILPNQDAPGDGGGVFIAAGNATLTHVTVAGNKATSGGGGMFVNGTLPTFPTVALTNTLVALNSAAIAPDYGGKASNSDHNLIGNADGSSGFSAAHGDLLGTTANPLNPHLGPLASNGGLTQTIALLPGSPAINAGDNNALAIIGPFDQRGFPRPAGGIIDIGAFEFQPQPSPPPAPPPTPPGAGSGTTAPKLLQTLLSLFLDGAALELASLQFEFVDNLDEFGIVPSVMTDAEAKAAAAGINFDAVLSLAQTLGRLTGRDLPTAEADIHFNLPYGGPFTPFAVVSGANAALQAVQQPPSE